MIENGNKILFQGDSITDMRRSRGENISHNLGHGYVYLIASYLTLKHSNKNLNFLNRGIAQNKIEDIKDRLDEDAISIKPDVISFLVGINNVGAIFNNLNTTSVESLCNSYTYILDKLKEESNVSTIIICEPFTLPVANKMKNWPHRRAILEEIHDELKSIAKEFDAKYIPLQSVFEEAAKQNSFEYWLYDGTHPTPAGHALIAKTWLKEVMDIEF